MKTQSNKVMLYALTSLVSLCTTANASTPTAEELQNQINEYVKILVTAPQVADYISTTKSEINNYTNVTDREGLRKLIEAIEKEKGKFNTKIEEEDDEFGIAGEKKLQTLEETLNEKSLTLDKIKQDLDDNKYNILDFKDEDITYNGELSDLSFMIPKGTKVNVKKYKDGTIKMSDQTKTDAQLGKWKNEQIKNALQAKITLGIDDATVNATRTLNNEKNITDTDALVKLYLDTLNNDKELKCNFINKILSATLTKDDLTETEISHTTTKEDLENEYTDKLLIPVSKDMLEKSGYKKIIESQNLELRSGVKKTETGEHVTDILTNNGIEKLLKLLEDSARDKTSGKKDLIKQINKTLKTTIPENQSFAKTTPQIIKAITDNMKKPMLKATPQITELQKEITQLKSELENEKKKAKDGLKMGDPKVTEIIGVLLGKISTAEKGKILKMYPEIDQINPIYKPLMK